MKYESNVTMQVVKITRIIFKHQKSENILFKSFWKSVLTSVGQGVALKPHCEIFIVNIILIMHAVLHLKKINE